MAQSRRMSAVEAATNTFGGFVVALGCQMTFFPWFGVHITLTSSAGIAVLMMGQSLVRQYLFRRFFAWLERREESKIWDNSECKPLIDNEAIVRLGQH